MTVLQRASLTVFLAAAGAMGATISAHHGSAAYHTDREVTVSGRVAEWRWTQPHTWVVLTAARAEAGDERWELEGPPQSWAQQRNWSATSLRAGESIQVVIYPSRSDARGGLIKRIVRASGETLPVSRPWLDCP